jgi:hypothetical protein
MQNRLMLVIYLPFILIQVRKATTAGQYLIQALESVRQELLA